MPKHPVELTDEALEEIIRQLDDPDEQDSLVDEIVDALERLPRRHSKVKKLGTKTHGRRDSDWTVIYEVDDADPPGDEEDDDRSGAKVSVRHVWRNQGKTVDDMLRERLGK